MAADPHVDSHQRRNSLVGFCVGVGDHEGPGCGRHYLSASIGYLRLRQKELPFPPGDSGLDDDLTISHRGLVLYLQLDRRVSSLSSGFKPK